MIDLSRRHIQDYDHATGLQPHWGYVDRVLPCTNDAGSCAYLDQVYDGHDLSMRYTFIMWGVILGALAVWSLSRLLRFMVRGSAGAKALSTDSAAARKGSAIARFGSAISATSRRYLLPESIGTRVFGRVSRLQVLILTVIASYLIIFT